MKSREEIANTLLAPADMLVGAYVEASKRLGVYDAARELAYGGVSKSLKAMFTLNNELEIIGAGNVPPEGGMIFASNHQSWMDVQVLTAASPRKVHFVAKAEFMRWPVLRHLIDLSDSIFVRRGGDNAALDAIAAALRAGKAVGIYPEGTIPGEEEIPRHAVDPRTGLLKGHSGAVRLALAARVPIVPVGVSGTGRAFPPEVYPRLELLRMPGNTPVRIRFGAPMDLSAHYGAPVDHDTLRRLTDELMARVSALIDHKANYIPQEVPLPQPPRFDRIGVLLLHGFTSSLDCVRGLVPHLEKTGIPYRMPVLRGHGTSYKDLRGVTHRAWYVDAERAMVDLWNEGVDRIVVVGLSMGGLVALELGMRHPEEIAGVVTVAAALRFVDPLAFASPWLSKFVRYWPSPNAFRDMELARRSTNYPRFPTDAFASLYEYSRFIESRLIDVHVPIRIIHSKGDQVVAAESANIIYEKVSSRIREIVWFRRSGHEMMMDMEAPQVFDTIMDFVTKFARPSPAAGGTRGLE